MFDVEQYIENGCARQTRVHGPNHAPCREGVRYTASGSKRSAKVAVHGRELDGTPLPVTRRYLTATGEVMGYAPPHGKLALSPATDARVKRFLKG